MKPTRRRALKVAALTPAKLRKLDAKDLARAMGGGGRENDYGGRIIGLNNGK